MIGRMQHFAKLTPYTTLYSELEARRAKGLVYRIESFDGLYMYMYSAKCVKEHAWDDYTKIATGLILDSFTSRVVCITMPKFFEIPDSLITNTYISQLEATEKMDGDLVILYNTCDRWRIATKEGFEGPVQRWAQAHIKDYNLDRLNKTTTYLFEAICPASKGIVNYEKNGLFLITSYNEFGFENFYHTVRQDAYNMGIAPVQRYFNNTIEELHKLALVLPSNQEGFVLKYGNGIRVSIEGRGYRDHVDTLKEITPLKIWTAMLEGAKLSEIRLALPTVYWQDFDLMVSLIHQKLLLLIREIRDKAEGVSELSHREVGKSLHEMPESVRNFIFPYRHTDGDLLGHKTARFRLFDAVRPTGNNLKGYIPSRQLRKVLLKAA